MNTPLPFGGILALSDLKIKSLKSKDKPYKVSDSGGLYILVNPSGSKLWRQKYRYQGKEKTLSHGPYPQVSLKQARSLRDDAKIALADAQDPGAVKKQAKAASAEHAQNTFQMFADQFLEKQIKENKSEATIKKKKWLLSLAMDDLGDLPINDINAQTILRTLRQIEDKGNYETVNRLRSTISQVFRYAIASGVAENDPTFGLKDALIRPTVQHRAAITDKETLTRFLQALDDYDGQPETRLSILLLILFACRPSELRLAYWKEFNFEKKVWTVPGGRMKMRREHQVPLSDYAIEQLHRLRAITGWNDRLFPSQVSSKKFMSENTMNQAIRRMGFEKDEATAHGFRATFSTFANESGLWSPDAIEAYCARQDTNAVRRTYNRTQYWGDRVKIADWWSGVVKEMSRIG